MTLIRGQIELQPGIEKKELIYREIDLMARQVRQLLHLAEVSESQNFEFGDVNRAAVADDGVLGRSLLDDAGDEREEDEDGQGLGDAGAVGDHPWDEDGDADHGAEAVAAPELDVQDGAGDEGHHGQQGEGPKHGELFDAQGPFARGGNFPRVRHEGQGEDADGGGEEEVVEEFAIGIPGQHERGHVLDREGVGAEVMDLVEEAEAEQRGGEEREPEWPVGATAATEADGLPDSKGGEAGNADEVSQVRSAEVASSQA